MKHAYEDSSMKDRMKTESEAIKFSCLSKFKIKSLGTSLVLLK